MKSGIEANRRCYARQQAEKAERSAHLKERIVAAAKAENNPNAFWTVLLWEDYGERP